MKTTAVYQLRDDRRSPPKVLQYLNVTGLKKGVETTSAYVGVAASHIDDDGLEFVIFANTMVDLEKALARLESPANGDKHLIVHAWRCAFVQAENVVITPPPKWHDPESTLRPLRIDEEDLI